MDFDRLHQPLQYLFQQHPVQLAYLFGSQGTGYTHSESDVDVAVLLEESLTNDKRYAEQLTLIGALECLFSMDNVDMVILNDASPLLAYEALRHGVLLYCVSEQTRIEFQVHTLRVYEDTAPLRAVLAKAMAARLKAGTFGKPVLTHHR